MRIFDNAFSVEKYIFPLSLDALDFAQRESISNLLHYLDDFMNTLSLELNRIDENYDKVLAIENKRLITFDDRSCLVALWADYYFFVNTVDRTYQVAMELYGKLNQHEKAEKIRYSDAYKTVHKIRNRIEHLSERAAKAGGNFYSQHRSMGPDREITIDGITFKAHETSLQVLYQIYDDISNIIRQKYIEPNKEIVDRLGFK